MRKTTYLLLLLVFVFSNCRNDINDGDFPLGDRTITIKATMPGTALDNEDAIIASFWAERDEMQFSFVQGDKAYKSVASASKLQNGSRDAFFEVKVPQEISNNAFDLYGIYGGGGLDDADPTMALLCPETKAANASVKYDREQMHKAGKIMLKFEKKSITYTDKMALEANLEHMGILVAFHVKNTTGAGLTLPDEFKFQAKQKWIYNCDNNRYNLKDHSFTKEKDDFLLWEGLSSDKEIMNLETRTYWQWIPVAENIPEMISTGTGKQGAIQTENALQELAAEPGDIIHIRMKFVTPQKTEFVSTFSDIVPVSTFDDIQYWVGEGDNRAALVIFWWDEKIPDGLTWGFRWDDADYPDGVSALDLLKSITSTDKRLTMIYDEKGMLGYGFLERLAYKDEEVSHDIYVPAADWATDGYWSYFIKEDIGDDFSYSSVAPKLRIIENNSWDCWSFSDDMSSMEGRYPDAEFYPVAIP